MTMYEVPWSLSVFDLAHNTSPQNIYSSNPRYYLRWSQDIEARILSHNLRCDVFVGFQRLSIFVERRACYARLASVAPSIWLFAQPDLTQDPVTGMHLIPLSAGHELAREWFLLVNHPRYARLFVARELAPDLDGRRQWTGLLTSDRDIVAHAETTLLQALVQKREYASAGS